MGSNDSFDRGHRRRRVCRPVPPLSLARAGLHGAWPSSRPTTWAGTWYWNRYPGARCDAESLAYSFSFSEDLEQDWEWTERYATQPEILRYAEHVADRFDLRKSIRFEQTVVSARLEEDVWRVETDRGDVARGRFCVMATGCLSVPLVPDIPGLEEFFRRHPSHRAVAP